MAPTNDQIRERLAAIAAPGGGTLVDRGVLSDIVVTEGKVFFSLSVDAAEVKAWEPVRKQVEDTVKAMPGVVSAMVALTAERAGGAKSAPPPQAASPAKGQAKGAPSGPSGVPGVKAIIAVASGKGGVGKSTTSINLALALRDLGLKVGVLDADIYGPSMPKLLAIREKPQTVGGTRLKPISRYDLQVMSIGFLVARHCSSVIVRSRSSSSTRMSAVFSPTRKLSQRCAASGVFST